MKIICQLCAHVNGEPYRVGNARKSMTCNVCEKKIGPGAPVVGYGEDVDAWFPRYAVTIDGNDPSIRFIENAEQWRKDIFETLKEKGEL